MLQELTLEELRAMSAEALKQMLIDERIQERARKEAESSAEEAAKREALERRKAYIERLRDSGRIPRK